jgi:hypothetical protein
VAEFSDFEKLSFASISRSLFSAINQPKPLHAYRIIIHQQVEPTDWHQSPSRRTANNNTCSSHHCPRMPAFKGLDGGMNPAQRISIFDPRF